MMWKAYSLKKLFKLVSMLALAALLAGCMAEDANHNDGLKMAAMKDMPASVQHAPVTVQQAYQFAAANPDVLQHIPCYCGCGSMGHNSNYACYVVGEAADGMPMFDEHALGCSICVDITQDTMRLLEEGKPLAEIREYVDTTYAQYGPTNMEK